MNFPEMVQRMLVEAEEHKNRSGVCTFPCGGVEDCKCNQKPRRTVRIVRRKKGIK